MLSCATKQTECHTSTQESNFYLKPKHINIRFHWGREVLDEGNLQIEKVQTSNKGINLMTKPVAKEKHETCRCVAGIDVA